MVQPGKILTPTGATPETAIEQLRSRHPWPTQRPVRECARRWGRVLKVVSNTWLIDDRPWTLHERRLWLEEMPTALRRRLTAWNRARRGLDSAGNPRHA